jgi:pimeloyl-ACP methyl ester carboxylesterase
VGRQLRAILASGSRKVRLRQVKAPTLVIHGTVDPLAPPAQYAWAFASGYLDASGSLDSAV